jgi:hypothetical protein
MRFAPKSSDKDVSAISITPRPRSKNAKPEVQLAFKKNSKA